jgi:endonuclease-8
MPEGDTVFKLAAYLAPELSGRRLVAGLVGGRVCRGDTVDLAGRRIGAVFARGKHLFIELGDGELLRSHLGMWGSWHGYAPGEPWQRPRHQAAIVLDTGGRVFACFNPLEVEILREAGVRHRRLAIALGPDLLTPGIDLDGVLDRAHALCAPQAPVVDLLLDQRVAAGIGNVYKSEVLFLEGLDPLTPVGRLDDDRLRALYRRAGDLLGRNLSGGPRITRRANDEAGYLWVYGRTAQPCLRCSTPVRSARLGRARRSTHWCPACQPVTPPK